MVGRITASDLFKLPSNSVLDSVIFPKKNNMDIVVTLKIFNESTNHYYLIYPLKFEIQMALLLVSTLHCPKLRSTCPSCLGGIFEQIC
jgi:hypothetical protein